MAYKHLVLVRDKLVELREKFGEYPESFNLTYWGEYSRSCGFAGCAVGWATKIPEIQEAGLTLKKDSLFNVDHVYHKGVYNWDAVQSFFEVDEETADYMFEESSYMCTDIPLSGVIEHINNVLDNGGDVPDDV